MGKASRNKASRHGECEDLLRQNQALLAQNQLLERRLSLAGDKQLVLLNNLIDTEARVAELEGILLQLSDPENELARMEDVHLNKSDHLPPVDCPLLIEVDGELIPAVRTAFIANKSGAMVYRVKGGELEGRFPWTYP